MGGRARSGLGRLAKGDIVRLNETHWALWAALVNLILWRKEIKAWIKRMWRSK